MSSEPVVTRPIYRMKRAWLIFLMLLVYGLLASCTTTRVILKTASTKPKGALASPALAVSTLDNWQTSDAPRLKALLETYVYGRFPQNMSLSRKDQTVFEGVHFDNSAHIVLETIELQNTDIGIGREFGLVILRPVGAPRDIPVIMMENFCPNNAVIPHPDIPAPKGDYFSCDGKGFMNGVFGYFFGRYITTPPIKDIMQRGYALAVIFPSEFIPDRGRSGTKTLNQVFADQDETKRTHAIMAWAAQFSELSHYLKAEKGFTKTIAYGHSRYGKSALIAAAYDDSIDGVIAHQSGTGGASLTKDKNGEGIDTITENYPHWFVPKFAEYAQDKVALPVDQHFLLALIAPRPLFLGNARRDVWSDPNGAFRAAQAASEAYALYGSDGLRQTTLKAYDPAADIAFWMRPGTHGVVKEDWPAFLEFLDAHFK